MLQLGVNMSLGTNVTVDQKYSGRSVVVQMSLGRSVGGRSVKVPGESNRDWFSLKLKLDSFTLGFQTRYTDTAGGCEEVITVGGGIRTGARTGVELDKQNKVDGAAEGKILAGGAAAEQANCIWLISGETMTLNFLKKSVPRMGPATAACRKVDVKSLP
jgi:hypothetical protein